jgi:hypothetical protein
MEQQLRSLDLLSWVVLVLGGAGAVLRLFGPALFQQGAELRQVFPVTIGPAVLDFAIVLGIFLLLRVVIIGVSARVTSGWDV